MRRRSRLIREGEGVKRAATPREINEEYERVRNMQGRPLTFAQIQALDAELARIIERDSPPPIVPIPDPSS